MALRGTHLYLFKNEVVGSKPHVPGGIRIIGRSAGCYRQRVTTAVQKERERELNKPATVVHDQVESFKGRQAEPVVCCKQEPKLWLSWGFVRGTKSQSRMNQHHLSQW